MKAITGDADALLAAASTLEQRGESLSAQRAALARSSTQAVQGWSGSASLQFAARSGQTQQLLASRAGDLAFLAAATRMYAVQLQSAQDQARALSAGAEQALFRGAVDHRSWETRQLLAPAAGAPGPSPLERAQVYAGQLAVRGDEVSREHGIHQGDLARALIERDPWFGLSGWMAGGPRLGQAIHDGAGLVEGTGLLLRYAQDVRRNSQYKSRIGERAQAQRLQSILRSRETLREFKFGGPPKLLPKVLPGARMAAGRLFLPLTILEGSVDAVVGDPAHPGWRDKTTRVMGVAGAGGAGLLIAAPFLPATLVLGPVGLGVAGAVVVGYGAWKLGTEVWDHRAEIAAFGRKTLQVGKRMWDTNVKVLSRAAQVGREEIRKVGDGIGRARETIADGARTVSRTLTAPLRLLPHVSLF